MACLPRKKSTRIPGFLVGLWLSLPLTKAFSAGTLSTIILPISKDEGLLQRRRSLVFLSKSADSETMKKRYRRPRSIALNPLADNDDDDNDIHVQASGGVANEDIISETTTLLVVVDEFTEPVITDEFAEPVIADGYTANFETVSHSEKPLSMNSMQDLVVSDGMDQIVTEVTNTVLTDSVAVTMKESGSGTDSLTVSNKASSYIEVTESAFFVEKKMPKKLDESELQKILDKFTPGESAVQESNREELLMTLDESFKAVSLEQEEITSREETVKNEEEPEKEEIKEADKLVPPAPPQVQPPTALLPKREWDANVVCAQAFAAVEQHPILLFDGACNLCNDWVNFCLDYDVDAKFRFASLQSKVGQSILIRDGRSPDDRSDVILATPLETFSQSDAVLRIISQLEGLPVVVRLAATLARFLLPEWFRDAVYKFASSNRHVFGDTDGPVCRLDLDGEYFGRFIEDPEFYDYDENLASESEDEIYITRR